MSLYYIEILNFITLKSFQKYNNKLDLNELSLIKAQGYYKVTPHTFIININHTINPGYTDVYKNFRDMLLTEIRDEKLNSIL